MLTSRKGEIVRCAQYILVTLFLSLGASRLPAQTATVLNSNLSLTLDLSNGITLDSIQDVVTRHEYVAQPTSLFEFAVNNGTPYQSNNGVMIDNYILSGQSMLTITAHATNVPVNFIVVLTVNPGDTAVVVSSGVTNTGSSPMFLRMVYPKVFHLVTPGDYGKMMGVVPQEIGSSVPLRLAPPGSAVASVLRSASQEDLFVVGYDGAIWTLFVGQDSNGNWQGWSKPIRLTSPGIAPPGSPLAAVKRQNNEEDVFVVGNDGAITMTSETNDGGWTDGVELTGALAPAGACITAIEDYNQQEEVFVAGNDGGIWTDANNGSWSGPVALQAPISRRPEAVSRRPGAITAMAIQIMWRPTCTRPT
ncbi:MAG TPA: hypothetical protein VKU00_31430 [Chthonomonadaceae bacterium]|nr:hypothetical protein [Chthonomonadaceae bacterium]